MSVLSTIMDKKACGGSGLGLNTGKLGCLQLFGQPTHLVAIKKGFIIPAETDFTLEYVQNLVQTGVMIPLTDASTFEDVSADDTYTTDSAGVKRLDLQGLPEYKMTFEEGNEFYRELSKIRSYKTYDFAIIDDENNWMLAKTSTGDYKGFTAGHVTPSRRMNKVKGGTSESKAVLVQFTDRIQFDTAYGIIHAEEVGFTAQEIPAVNGVALSFIELPTAGATIKVKAVLRSDMFSVVEGLLIPNFLVTVAGVTVVPSAIAETTPGEYTLTVAAMTVGQMVVVDLFDSTKNVNITVSEAVLYRSESVGEAVIV
jgi:hypothetical protein